MVAHQYWPDTNAAFWVGNIAPDCINDWQTREHFHLRHEPDMEKGLRNFEQNIDENDFFTEGMLLHLFVDWQWGLDFIPRYIEQYKGTEWHGAYRRELGILGAALYRQRVWIQKVWDEMLGSDIPSFLTDMGASAESITEMMTKANAERVETINLMPQFYDIDEVKAFTVKAAKDYTNWRIKP